MSAKSDPRLLVTPLAKVTREFAHYRAFTGAPHKTPVVLVSSGAFCPVHRGHLEMMDSAKREVERHGSVVVGGFLAPDHDGYVAPKCGSGALSGSERVHLVQTATSDSSWLTVDPWAALYVDRAVNFTDIIRRLTRYLRAHVHQDIQVAFVCGADNSGFSKAFVKEGMLVIVPRGNESVSVEGGLLATGRVMIATDHVLNAFASRAIRAGSSEGVPTLIRAEREALRRRERISRVAIRLRDEEEWLVEPWTTLVEPSILAQAQRRFASSLQQIFEDNLRVAYRAADISVTRLSVARQRELVARFATAQSSPIISLDACISGDISIGLSRHFEITSGERIAGLFSRPGGASLQAQIAAIPKGRFILMDDDIATGRTIRDFMAMLPSCVTIEQVVSIHELECGEKMATVEVHGGNSIIDGGDVRDFLIGSREGGLVVRLPNGGVSRVPYLAPYVRTSCRMSLPLSQELTFALQVWKLNEWFFNHLPVSLQVTHASESFQSFARYVGFKSTDTLASVCAWHSRELAGGTFRMP
jgi:nicotinic acid mononucleotide adenylyltransferase